MPKIKLLNDGTTYEYESKDIPYGGHGKPLSLLDLAEHFGFHIEHACGGSCACTTCHVIVRKGQNNLSEMEDDEQDRLDMAPGLELNSRLGCQCVVKGDVEFEIPSWNRNYVSEGGGSINLGDAIPLPKK